MSDPFNAHQRINLAKASVMLADASPGGLGVLLNILAGFGVRNFHKCSTSVEAQAALHNNVMDLIITDATLADTTGYDFVRWLRQSRIEPNCYSPVILLTGHTRVSNITKGRDCGANFVVAKPLTAAVMLERILWVARENRPIIDAGDYVGPERRFKSLGPPPGIMGRRKEDQTAQSGDSAAETNPQPMRAAQ